MSPMNIKWVIRTERMYPPDQWAFGFGLSHWGEETYLYINLLFINVSIGKQYIVEE